jgi:hypothetical protein
VADRAWVLVHVRPGQVNSLLDKFQALNESGGNDNHVVRCDEIADTPYCMVPLDAPDRLEEWIKEIKGYDEVDGILALRVKKHHPGKHPPQDQKDDLKQWEDPERPLNGWG